MDRKVKTLRQNDIFLKPFTYIFRGHNDKLHLYGLFPRGRLIFVWDCRYGVTPGGYLMHAFN